MTPTELTIYRLLRCEFSLAHYRRDFVPVSRFDPEQLKEVLLKMDSILERDSGPRYVDSWVFPLLLWRCSTNLFQDLSSTPSQ